MLRNRVRDAIRWYKIHDWYRWFRFNLKVDEGVALGLDPYLAQEWADKPHRVVISLLSDIGGLEAQIKYLTKQVRLEFDWSGSGLVVKFTRDNVLLDTWAPWSGDNEKTLEHLIRKLAKDDRDLRAATQPVGQDST